MSLGFKSLNKQVEELSEFLSENPTLVLATFIISFFINSKPIDNQTQWQKMLFGTSYLFTIFLLLILCYQLYAYKEKNTKEKTSLWEDFKQFNHLLYILLLLLIIFTMSLILSYFERFPNEIITAAGFTLAIWLAVPLLLISIGIPIFILDFIYRKASSERLIKNKILIYLLSFLLFGVSLPIITYFIKEKIGLFIFLIGFFILIGWLLLLLGIIDIIETIKKNKNKSK